MAKYLRRKTTSGQYMRGGEGDGLDLVLSEEGLAKKEAMVCSTPSLFRRPVSIHVGEMIKVRIGKDKVR